ncbi:MAG: outer membrane lipoprotein-sorting protein [Deltaproteobacteria bacterium]|nr:outer membrane lipoprotein-sorting protein [Deltaproteobacteria bacterium]
MNPSSTGFDRAVAARRPTAPLRAVALGLGLAFGLSLAGAPPAAAAEPTIAELLDATDDLNRGASSHGVMAMQVQTARYTRSMKMEVWSQGEDRSLVRLLEPAKDKGVSTLRSGDNIWNYLPNVDRTVKVPAAMMGGAWMGSHITNDDLVRSSRLADDFSATMVAKPGVAGATSYRIELVAKPDAPVVWGKVMVEIGADKLPRKVEYFDEKGTLVRTLSFEEVKTIDGKPMPTVQRVVPADKPGEFTLLRVESMDFDVALPESTFTLQALKP